MQRLTKKQIQDARLGFWIAWTLFIAMPASMAAFMFSYGTWWVSTLTTIISTILAYNIFEIWLKRRQERATNTLVLCYCGHEQEEHAYGFDTKCRHTCSDPEGRALFQRNCLCSNYTPRFWQMSRRT